MHFQGSHIHANPFKDTIKSTKDDKMRVQAKQGATRPIPPEAQRDSTSITRPSQINHSTCFMPLNNLDSGYAVHFPPLSTLKDKNGNVVSIPTTRNGGSTGLITAARAPHVQRGKRTAAQMNASDDKEDENSFNLEVSPKRARMGYYEASFAPISSSSVHGMIRSIYKSPSSALIGIEEQARSMSTMEDRRKGTLSSTPTKTCNEPSDAVQSLPFGDLTDEEFLRSLRECEDKNEFNPRSPIRINGRRSTYHGSLRKDDCNKRSTDIDAKSGESLLTPELERALGLARQTVPGGIPATVSLSEIYQPTGVYVADEDREEAISAKSPSLAGPVSSAVDPLDLPSFVDQATSTDITVTGRSSFRYSTAVEERLKQLIAVKNSTEANVYIPKDQKIKKILGRENVLAAAQGYGVTLPKNLEKMYMCRFRAWLVGTEWVYDDVPCHAHPEHAIGYQTSDGAVRHIRQHHYGIKRAPEKKKGKLNEQKQADDQDYKSNMVPGSNTGTRTNSKNEEALETETREEKKSGGKNESRKGKERALNNDDDDNESGSFVA